MSQSSDQPLIDAFTTVFYAPMDEKNERFNEMEPLLTPFLKQQTCRVQDRCEDILQDCLKRISRSIERLKELPENIMGWLSIIASNACRAMLKKELSRQESLMPEGFDVGATESPWQDGGAKSLSPWEKLDKQRKLAQIYGFLRTLKKGQAQIALLHWKENMKKSEIAVALGMKESTVNTTIGRLEKKLINHFRALFQVKLPN